MAIPHLHVIICSWNRIDGIISLLNDLNEQTYSDFRVTIVNNKFDVRHELENRINSVKPSYPLEVTHNKMNLGGRARFIEATKTDSPYCVFIDDDQCIGNSVLDNMAKTAGSRTICAWWAWKFGDNYWNRSPVINGNTATYCGTGGMVLDSSLFKIPNFWDNWNEKFYFVEDLYASLYATSVGWKLKGYKYDIKFNPKLASDTNSLYLNPNVANRKQELVMTFKQVNNMKPNEMNEFSYKYWETRYSHGGNSGSGSYGNGLHNKLQLLNSLISKYDIKTIADIGCGDCTILNGLSPIEKYIGYDISPTIINRHTANNTDSHRQFKLIEGTKSIESDSIDLTLSLEVIFHQVIDTEYIEYMDMLLKTNATFILLLTMNERVLTTEHIKSQHIKYRDVRSFMTSKGNYELIDTFPFTVDTSTYYLYKKCDGVQ